MQTYLGTEEAAVYLGIRERKLYELVSAGRIPCSKVTGKWLFPRAALDRWVESGMVIPAGLAPEPPPPIISGSHDPLLEWAARRSGSGLALLSEGSGAGLTRLERNEAAIAAIHLHVVDDTEANPAAVLALRNGQESVLIAFARREQGLLVASGNPRGLTDIDVAVDRGARFGFRQHGAGAQQLLGRLLARTARTPESLDASATVYTTGQDLAFAIRSGEIDCGLATRAVAQAAGLDFVPALWENFDLVLRRRTYFEPGPQALFSFMRRPEFHRQAESFGGYDTGMAGQVRLNR